MSLSSMPVLDVILGIFLLVFVSIGFWFGLIHMLGSLVGLVGGIIISGLYYGRLADFLSIYFDVSPGLMGTISFFLILTVISRLIGFMVSVIDRIFSVTSIVPFVKTFDRILGAFVGLLEGMAAIGILLYFAGHFPLEPMFESVIRSSFLANTLYMIGGLLAPLLPKAFQAIQPIIG